MNTQKFDIEYKKLVKNTMIQINGILLDFAQGIIDILPEEKGK